MKDYIEECQAIANPFTHRSDPSRPNPLTFAKQPKANQKTIKLSKINVGYHPAFFQ